MSKVFNMVGGGGGVTASIFVNGLSETDTVTATNGSKTLVGKWTQKPNPAIRGLPDGYTQLEYIESSGTQYINSGVSPNKPLKVVSEASFSSSSQDWNVLIAANTNNSSGADGYHVQRRSSGVMGYQYNNNSFIDSISLTSDVFYKIEFDAKAGLQNLFVDDTLVASSTDANLPNNTNSLFIFACNSAGTATWVSVLKLKYLSLESNGEILRNFIPAKRNSDSVVGLYDIVNGVFYENAGTGTFVAGPEVPQTVGVFLISKIKDYGTWTVNATNGTNTATQDVLVDVITEYVIYMELKNYLMLYDFGDECEDVTGGWTDGLLNDNNIYPYLRYIRTQLRIDASEYTKCAINVSFGNSTDIGGNGILVGDTPPNVQSWRALNPSDIQTSGLSVHNMNANEGYFHIGVDNGTMTSNSVTKNQNNIYVYTRSGSSFVRELYMYNFALCKQDDWLTLCTKAGITAPSDLATLIADTTSIAAILANEEAVKFAVSNCTGDFMVSFVASSACLTALTSSPYESVIRANRHWAKFLAMVQ